MRKNTRMQIFPPEECIVIIEVMPFILTVRGHDIMGDDYSACHRGYQLLTEKCLFLCVQVTVIPTFESVLMQEWYQQTLDRQRELSITVLGSNSTVAMQDETFPACNIEF